MTRNATLPTIHIDSPNQLPRLVDDCRRAKRIAFDMEADSLHHYFEKVCLMQIGLGSRQYILDPLAVEDLSPLLSVLADKPLLVHGGDYDVRMLRASYGFEARGEIFDTMIAAQLLGFEELGLAALVKRYFGVELPKHGQRSDWSRRPLPADLLEYAANDTRYLEPLVDLLTGELEKLDRRDWHREACARMVEASKHTNSRDPDREWRVKGTGQLKDLELALLKELWHWRDAQARRADRPSFKVLNNQAMIALAQWAAAHPKDDLSKGPKLPRNCKRQRLAALKEALEKGLGTPKAQWPSRHPARNGPSLGPRPSEELVKKLLEARDEIAKTLELPPSVLAPRAVLLSLASTRPKTLGEMIESGPMMRWQGELLAEKFQRVL